MRKLIINADDFGMSREVNEGVEKAINLGVLSNVSLMVNLPYFNDAVSFLRNHPEVSVGLHFNVTEGKPVLDPSEVGSLLKEDDSFYFWTDLVPRLIFRGAKVDEIKKELTAQYQKLIDTGLQVSHIDSHHHVHLFPTLYSLFAEFADEKRVNYLRSQHFNVWSLTAGINKRPVLKQVIINLLLWFNSLFFNHRHMDQLDAIYDLNWDDNISEQQLLKIIDNLPEGKTEFICHLGVLSPRGNRKFLEPRLKILELLSEPSVKERILHNDISLLHRNGYNSTN